jgi:hypothetical protein
MLSKVQTSSGRINKPGWHHGAGARFGKLRPRRRTAFGARLSMLAGPPMVKPASRLSEKINKINIDKNWQRLGALIHTPAYC